MWNVDELIDHLEFLAKRFCGYDKKYIAEILLLEIGIPTRGSGFNYLVDAILFYHQDSMKMVTKEIYPSVAKKYGIYVRPVQVEGSIRKAIESAWKHRDRVWECFFPKPQKPTNSEFISRIAKALELWDECCERISRSEGGA